MRLQPRTQKGVMHPNALLSPLSPQPRLGGDSRPVQRPQVNEVTPESSFDFLGKSSKGSAFDFVKEEIDSAKKK